MVIIYVTTWGGTIRKATAGMPQGSTPRPILFRFYFISPRILAKIVQWRVNLYKK